ncbi:MAG: hypothetical protein Q8S00_00975 [Deltaproteobacteria bacterium]|nr:hypothetical protein [Deltaproteobacteria bacterium]
MAFDPKNFYTIAQWLVGQNKDEAGLRTAISRVYYAAHHIAATRLVQKGSWTPQGFAADHGGVIDALKQGRLRQRGDELEALRILREHSDYHLDASITIGNQERCSHCKKIRTSSSPTDVVTNEHWKEVTTIASRCIPLLEKI